LIPLSQDDLILRRDITTEELMSLDYHYNYTDRELLDDWMELCNIVSVKKGSQFKPGMKLCQHFFPNFWNIRNNKGLSFADCWKDRELMDKVREWGIKSMGELWMSWIRRAVFMAGGLPNSSFYRPHFSRQIIINTGKEYGTLFDPCAGWGGRMLGTISTGWSYVGCEPNPETYDNLCRMIEFLGIKSGVTLLNIPAEEYDYYWTKPVDVVLTSPPYFNLEVYTDDPQQCYNRYNNFDVWVENWLSPLISNSVGMLNDGGVSCWNVMNFGKNDLANRVIDIHSKLGWELKKTLGFKSPIANIRTVKNKDLTYLFERMSND